jgi:hypothetical protein
MRSQSAIYSFVALLFVTSVRSQTISLPDECSQTPACRDEFVRRNMPDVRKYDPKIPADASLYKDIKKSIHDAQGFEESEHDAIRWRNDSDGYVLSIWSPTSRGNTRHTIEPARDQYTSQVAAVEAKDWMPYSEVMRLHPNYLPVMSAGEDPDLLYLAKPRS